MGARNHEANTGTSDTSSSDVARFNQLERKAEEATAQATQRLQTFNQKLLKAHRGERKKLQAALDETRSGLELLQAGLASVRELTDFVRTSGVGNSRTGNLASIIDNLARTAPEATGPTTVQSPTQNPDPPSPSKPRGPGILGMGSELSALQRKLHTVDEEISLTDNLAGPQKVSALLLAVSSMRLSKAAISAICR